MTDPIDEILDRHADRRDAEEQAGYPVTVQMLYEHGMITLDWICYQPKARNDPPYLEFPDDDSDALGSVFRTDELDPERYEGWEFEFPDGDMLHVLAMRRGDRILFAPQWRARQYTHPIHCTALDDGSMTIAVPIGTKVRGLVRMPDEEIVIAALSKTGSRRAAIFRLATSWLAVGRSPFGIDFITEFQLGAQEIEELRHDLVGACRLVLGVVDLAGLDDEVTAGGDPV